MQDLPALTLDEVNDRAALQTRVDRKYIVQPDAWQAVLAGLDRRPNVLQIDGLRSFHYASTYYDTAELTSYRDAARKRPRRFKVRIRRYLDTGSCAVEVKLRSYSGSTAKSRLWLEAGTFTESGRLPAAAADFVAGFDVISDRVHELAEVLSTAYERVTLVSADARVTVDQDVTAADAHGRHMAYGDLLIVETKSARGAGVVDRALWAGGIRPIRISKYATSLAVLHPELPANKWSRTMRRHLPANACAPYGATIRRA